MIVLGYDLKNFDPNNHTSPFMSLVKTQVGWNIGRNLTIGGREFPYAGYHLKGIVTDVQVESCLHLKVTLLDFSGLFKSHQYG